MTAGTRLNPTLTSSTSSERQRRRLRASSPGRPPGWGCRGSRPSCRPGRPGARSRCSASAITQTSGCWTSAAIGDDRHPLGAGQQDVGLVGDAEGVLPGADGLQHDRRVGRGVEVDLEPGGGEIAARLGEEEPGVVGVRDTSRARRSPARPRAPAGDARQRSSSARRAGADEAAAAVGETRAARSDGRHRRPATRR